MGGLMYKNKGCVSLWPLHPNSDRTNELEIAGIQRNFHSTAHMGHLAWRIWHKGMDNMLEKAQGTAAVHYALGNHWLSTFLLRQALQLPTGTFLGFLLSSQICTCYMTNSWISITWHHVSYMYLWKWGLQEWPGGTNRKNNPQSL